jgi:hypothetical protein
MPSYIKASMERSYAESFLAELERNDNQYFLFIGKGTTWANENSPPSYTDTVASEYRVMNDIIGYKKLSSENILFAIPRYEWTANTIYDQYDDSTELFNDSNPKIFYVVTDENHIYKCLWNNGSTNKSAVKPTLTITSPFTLSDGYTWQYLATVKESDLPYELTDYVPIDFAYTASDTETQNQYNAQIDAINSSITRISVQNSSTSPAVYPNTISESANTAWVLSVGDFAIDPNDSTKKYITVTEQASRERITVSRPDFVLSNYVGYIVRVNSSTVDPNQVNNYAVITAVDTSQANKIVFTVSDDAMNFTVKPTQSATNYTSVQILPYVKTIGNGNGAYAFPNMNADNTVSSVNVVSGGKNYSNVRVLISSFKKLGTTDPVLTPILSPKGGHGSNILKELNVKDVLIIVKVTEYDAQNIREGGTYRQFGIIKNPILRSTGNVAGIENTNFRDITLVSIDGVYDSGDFLLTNGNIIIGSESYASGKPVQIKSQTNDSVVLKTINTSGKFISRKERVNDYKLSIAGAGSDFSLGETVEQVVPAGTLIGGISYGFNINITGTVVETDQTRESVFVRLSSEGNFVVGKEITGLFTGVVATVTSVSPRYGEMVWVSAGDEGSLSFRARNNRVQKLYRVADVSQPYFDLEQTPSYRGLHVLNVASSVSGTCGAIDTTSAPLLPFSFSNGDLIQQGISSGFGHYASGTVYDWEYINPSSGRLYLTGVLGNFRSVATHGLTGNQIRNFVISSVEEPDIDQTSGEVVYITNVRPITRTRGQEEEFRVRLGF